jgi:hypothetical protein
MNQGMNMKIKKILIDKFALIKDAVHYILLCCIILYCSTDVYATIRFEDVSTKAGMIRNVQTAGSGWGDLNADGWPDLWVSNHDLQMPSLYLNMKNGTFVDIFEDVVVGEKQADFHGPAWADFDNDGDQDLFLISGGASGRGFSPNFLFVNNNGKLINQAYELGVDYPFGRGRTPLWFDADKDGKLDLLVMNRQRRKGKSPSAIFMQTANGFTAKNKKFGFIPSGRRTKSEKIKDLLYNAAHLRLKKGPGKIEPAEAFAILTDIDSGTGLELLAFSKPMRIYGLENIPFQEITNKIPLPSYRSVQDVAI